MTPTEREAIKSLASSVKVLAEGMAAMQPRHAELCAKIEQDMDDLVLAFGSRRTANLECGVMKTTEDSLELPPVGWYG